MRTKPFRNSPLLERLLQPERLTDLLAAHLDRREEREERHRAQASELTKRAGEAEQRLKRLYGAIESGIADLSDPSLKERLAELQTTFALLFQNGGEGGIRTHDTGLPYTPLAGERLQPARPPLPVHLRERIPAHVSFAFQDPC